MRYTGAKWRINRREQATVLGKSEKSRFHPVCKYYEQYHHPCIKFSDNPVIACTIIKDPCVEWSHDCIMQETGNDGSQSINQCLSCQFSDLVHIYKKSGDKYSSSMTNSGSLRLFPKIKCI